MKNKHRFKVSVVLPSYNERENIAGAIKKISNAVGKNLLEIIVIDDNSPDGTWKIVEEMKNSSVRLIRRMHEKGLASATARGLREAQGDVVAWLDCDLGIPPEIVPQLVKQLENYDVAIGSRYVPGGGDPRPFPRPFLSRCMNWFAGSLFGSQISDYTSCIAAVRKDVIRKVLWNDNGFGEYFAEFSYRCIKSHVRVIEIPVQYVIRKGGVSKSDGNRWVLFRYGIQYGLKMIQWRLTMR